MTLTEINVALLIVGPFAVVGAIAWAARRAHRRADGRKVARAGQTADRHARHWHNRQTGVPVDQREGDR